MKPENIDALEEPPPFRGSPICLLLSFWLLPFWCFSYAVSTVLKYPAPHFWLAAAMSLFVYTILMATMMNIIRHSSIFEYSFTGYYWISWIITIVFAPGLDSLYYAASDWQVAFLPNSNIMPTVIYGGIYYLLPACSLVFLGQMSWEYYSSYQGHVDWASILVDNTPFVAAVITWDSSLSDTGWLFISITAYIYYLIPRGYYSKLALKFSSAKLSSEVGNTTRKPFNVFNIR